MWVQCFHHKRSCCVLWGSSFILHDTNNHKGKESSLHSVPILKIPFQSEFNNHNAVSSQIMRVPNDVMSLPLMSFEKFWGCVLPQTLHPLLIALHEVRYSFFDQLCISYHHQIRFLILTQSHFYDGVRARERIQAKKKVPISFCRNFTQNLITTLIWSYKVSRTD